MSIREKLKFVAFAALGSKLNASFRAAAIRRAGPRIILNLHRVSEPDGSTYVPLQPKLFEELLVFLTKHFPLYTFHDEDKLPGVILSFDDGYKDFIEVAAPLMRKHRIRCNHNIIPGCVENGLPPLNVMAQDFVGMAPHSLVHQLDVPGFDLKGSNLGNRITTFIKNKRMAEQEQLAAHLVPQMFAWDGFRPTRMMSHSDVVQVASEHELGAHSYSHASMKEETLDYLLEDVQRCRSYFRKRLGAPMDIYAFPNGSCTIEQVEAVERAGVQHVLLVGETFDTHPTRHCRFTFDARSLGEMRFKALGQLQKVAL
jgi:peptidoglycan/xylan/chitin deacetylase (PgdA/CDA1 family)